LLPRPQSPAIPRTEPAETRSITASRTGLPSDSTAPGRTSSSDMSCWRMELSTRAPARYQAVAKALIEEVRLLCRSHPRAGRAAGARSSIGDAFVHQIKCSRPEWPGGKSEDQEEASRLSSWKDVIGYCRSRHAFRPRSSFAACFSTSATSDIRRGAGTGTVDPHPSLSA